MKKAKSGNSMKRVVITRGIEQTGAWAETIEQAGFEVVEMPLVHVVLGADKETILDVFDGLATYDWLIFSSVNGVRGFFKIFFEVFKDIRSIGPARIACVGKATAHEIEKMHLQVDLVPDEWTADELGKALIATGSLDNANVLVVTGNRNNPALVKELEENGHALVDAFPVYKTELNDLALSGAAADFREKGADVLILASPSAVESMIKQSSHLKLGKNAVKPKFISIGTVTSKAMQAAKLPIDAECAEASAKGIVDALKKLF